MKSFPKIRTAAAFPVLLIIALLLLQQSSLFGQATGSVTGIVADPTGAVIPNATVVLTNHQTGVSRQTVSNGAGYFAFAAVGSGTNYALKVTAQQFKAWQSQPFAVRPGDKIDFSDIAMQLGAASTEVTVEATGDAVKVLDSGERSDVINSKEIKTLSVVGRNATELIRMLPGFAMASGSDQGVNNKPGYNTAVVGLSSPTGGFSANGTGTTGISVVSDGASLTDIQSNAGTIQNVNIDMVEEIKVSTSTYGAENAKGPTVVNAIGKSGSSEYHGSVYLHARDGILNSNDWYDNYMKQSRPDGRFLYPGATIGGPVTIPGTSFNKNKDKMFFFVGIEVYRQRYESAVLGSWVPTLAERRGDFSQQSLDAQLCGARPDGQPNPNAIKAMCHTMNYMPGGTLDELEQPHAITVDNGNVAAWANDSGVALVNWLPLPNADPFTNASGYNYIKQVTQEQNGSEFRGRIDYSFNDNNKLFANYSRQGQIQQVPIMKDYIPTGAMAYPGGVTSGDISHSLSLNYTRILSPTLTNELTVTAALVSQPGNMDTPTAVSRFDMNESNGGNGNFYYLGQFKNSGDYSVPALQNNNNLGYPNMLMPGGFYNNQVRMKKVVPNLADTVSWVKGTHFLKAGVYFEKGILNGLAINNTYPQGMLEFNPGNSYFEFSQLVGTAAHFTNCQNPDPAGNLRASGAAYLGNCMNPVALMYTGNASVYQQSNFSPVVNMQYTTLSGFLNDSWKLRRNLTVTLGARFEHIGGWNDRHGNGLAAFSPELYRQQCDDTNRRAEYGYCTTDVPGMMWHSANPSISNAVSKPDSVFVSPRLGVSWDIFGRGNTVLRGGWGVYRSQEEFQPYALAAATAQGYKNSHLQGYKPFDLIDSTSPSNVADFNAWVISPNDNRRPLHYEYNFAIAQRLPWQSLLEVAYVGNLAKNLSSRDTSHSDLNLMPYGTLFRANGAQLEDLPRWMSQNDGSGTDIGNLNTAEQDFFRPYPYYQHIYEIKHDFYSRYDSLQVSWNRNVGAIQYGANYTFAKNLAVAASYNNILVDPFNLQNDYNPVPYDRTHVFNVHYLVDIGTHIRGRFLGLLANGWQISGISTLQSGQPLASMQGGNLGFNNGRIAGTEVFDEGQYNVSMGDTCRNRYGIQSGRCTNFMQGIVWLGTPDIQLMPTVVCDPTSGLGANQYINPNCFGLPNIGENGAYRLPYIHGPAYLNHDLTLFKNFKMGEKKNLQLRLAAFNFLNHPVVSFNKNDTDNLTLAFQDAVPGQGLRQDYLVNQDFGIAGIKYGSRMMQLSIKFEF